MTVTVVGGFGLGISFFLERFPQAGETVNGAQLLETPGGKGSNQAIGVARLGASTRFITAIADDSVGQLGRNLWEEEGIDASSVISLPGSSMVGAVMTDKDAENRIIIADGVLVDLTREDMLGVDGAFVGSDVVLVSTEISSEAAVEALRRGREHGAYTILNPAPVPELSLVEWSDIDLITPNETEALTLLEKDVTTEGVDDPEALVSELSRRFHCSVVMTVGSKGAYAKTVDGDVHHVPSLPVTQLVDTTGAGDSFNAGLAYGIHEGLSLVEAAQLGGICGGITVQTAGVVPALPHRSDIHQYYKELSLSEYDNIASLFM